MESADREASFHPPSRIVFHGGGLAVAGTSHDMARRRYVESGETIPVSFFVRGDRYTVVPGIAADLHLFGVRGGPGAAKGGIYLMGTDQLGRDVFSRLLYGARVSLSVGILGIALSFVLGLLIGGLAGYYGGWVDVLLMRGSEILMSIPGLFLILALRSTFPDTLPSHLSYLLIVMILSFVSWPALGRIVRGMVLSIRTRDYVTAAEALGFSPLRIIAGHILPNTMSFVVVAATVSIPGYILSEVALSFLGAGIQEPSASWGNMLQSAASVSNMEAHPWILWPGVFIFAAVFAFNVLGDGLRDALDPRHIDA
jgi:peptide/nickel transport system permease protein